MKKTDISRQHSSTQGGLRIAAPSALASLGLLASSGNLLAMGSGPVAHPDEFYTSPGVPFSDNVTTNDNCGNTAATLQIVQQPAHGQFDSNSFVEATTCGAPGFGSFNYAPAPGFHGRDSFTYRLQSGPTQSNVVTATIYVADAPAAPRELRGSASNAAVTLSFLEPVNAADAPITGYEWSSDGNTFTSLMSTSSPVTLPGVGAGSHNLQLRALNHFGPGDVAEITVTGGADLDVDQIPDSIEDLVPDADGTGLGDGDGNGIPDSSEAAVASVPAGNSYATVKVDAPATLSAVVGAAVPDDFPGSKQAPLGGANFTVGNLSSGATAQVSLYVPSGAGVEGLLKKNYATGAWDSIPATVVQQGAKTRLTFQLTDGGDYDADRSANGSIADPVFGVKARGGDDGAAVSWWALPVLLLGGLLRRLRGRVRIGR